MAHDIIGYLSAKGLNPKRATGGNVNVHCMFCGEDPGKRGRLYINADPNAEIPGLFMCHLCGERGALNKIRKHYGDPPISDERGEPERFSKVYAALQEAANYYHERLFANFEALSYLMGPERGLTEETIREHRLGLADGKLIEHFADMIASGKYDLEDIRGTRLFTVGGGGPSLRDFLPAGSITIPYISHGSITMIRGKDRAGGRYLTPPGAKSSLFNVDSLFTADVAVICEGEFDALIAEQLGFCSVGVAGANTWQEAWNGYFDDVRRIYAVFDNDDSGRSGLQKIKANLPRVRTTTVPPSTGPDDHNDLTAWCVSQGHTREDFQELLRKTEGGLLVTVDEAFTEHQELQGLDGFQMGYESVDTLIQPGVLPSQLLILLAKTGTGKTISLLNIFHRALMVQPDLKILFLSLEQTRGDWFERARRIWAFYHIDELAPASLDEADLEKYRKVVHDRTLDFWREHLLIVDKNRVSEHELVASLEDFETLTGEMPGLIAVDYLGYWAASFRGRDKYEKVTDAVMSLKAVGKDHRIPVITPHQVNRMVEFGGEVDVDSARDSGVVEETGDFVFSMWSPDSMKGKDHHEATGEVKLKIGKSRHGNKGVVRGLQLAPLTLVLLDQQDGALVQLARHELQYRHEAIQRRRPITWEEAIYRHAQLDGEPF